MKILLFMLCAVSSALAIDARSVTPAGAYQEKSNPSSGRPSAPGTGWLEFIDNGAWVKYTQVDFGSQPVESINIRACSGGSGGRINVRLGSNTGHLLGSVTIPNTGGWGSIWTFRSAINHPVTPVTGMNDLVLEFVDNGMDLFNVIDFVFDTSLSWRSDVSAGEFLRESHSNNDAIIKKEGDSLLNATNGSWAGYGLFDFGPGMNYLWIDVLASTAIQNQNPRRVEFRTDSPTGNLIGALEIPNTNGLYKPLGLKFAQPVVGTKRLFLNFVGPQGDFFSFKKFHFQQFAPDYKSVIIPSRIKRDPNPVLWTPAAAFSASAGVQVAGSRVEYITPNSTVQYTGQNIVAGSNRISIKAASPLAITGGGNVEVRFGSQTGPLLASLNVKTAMWNDYSVFTAKIPPVATSGPQNVFIKFTGTTGYVLNFESFRFHTGQEIADSSPGVTQQADGTDVISGLTHGSWVRYDGVNFGQNANLFTVKAATPNKGGAVEVRLDSLTGPHVATVDITHTGSFSNFRDYPERLQTVSGVRSVYLKFLDTHNQGGNLFTIKECIIETKSETPETPTHQGTLHVYPSVQGLAQSPYYTFEVQNYPDSSVAKQSLSNWKNPFAWFSEGRFTPEPYANNYYGWIAGWSHTYCNFEMGKNTPIVVKITRKSNIPDGAPAGPIFMANAHPAHKVQSCEIINGDVYVTMKEPALVTVDIDGQMDTGNSNHNGSPVTGAHAVSIFANPVISDKPSLTDTTGTILYINPGDDVRARMASSTTWNTLYFLPGVHSMFGFENGEPKTWEPGDKCLISNGQTIYIPGDAIVYGCFITKEVSHTNNVRFYGYGTLSGRYNPHIKEKDWWLRNGPNPAWGTDMDGDAGLKPEYGNNPINMGMYAHHCRFEGITCADPSFHGIFEQGGSNNLKRWVKQISWRQNTDMGGVVGTTEDCFFRLQDDGAYVENSDYRRNTFWFDVNGQAFRGSFIVRGTHDESHQTILEDCDIIYARNRFGGGTLVGIGSDDGTGTYPDGTKNTAQHMIYRNIRLTDPRPEYSLFGFYVPNKSDAFGVAGIRLENIESRHPAINGQKGYFLGSPLGPISYMYFDGVSAEGKMLDATRINDPTLFRPLENTSNFIFRDAPGSPIPPLPPVGITWTSAPYTVNGPAGIYLDTGKFAKDGTQILAENSGGGGVTFDDIVFSSPTISFGGTHGGFHDGASDLSRTGTYSGSASTVTIGSLTVGSTYRIQALVYDGRSEYNGRRVSFDGINQGQYANGANNVTWGNGLLVTGVFTADDLTQDFTIETFNSGGGSEGSQLNALLVHELAAGTPVVSNPAVTSITGTSVRINADLTASNADVTLNWDTLDQGTGTWTHTNSLGAQIVGPVGGNLTGLTPDTRYFYRFHAVNTAPSPDTESWSPAATSFVTVPTGKAPTGLTATPVYSTHINLTWTDVANTETGFVIERSPDGTSSWTQVGTAVANTQSFSDTGLVPETLYHYRVIAQNGAGSSEPSTVASATTNAVPSGIQVQAWFHLGDSGQGTDKLPKDSSGNNRNFLNHQNGPQVTVNPTGGGYSNDAYYSFSGHFQGFYDIGYDPQENNVGIEVWVRTSSLGQDDRHIFGTGSNNDGLNVSFSPSAGWSGAISNVVPLGSAPATANKWTHLAVVRDSGVATFYVNGVATGSTSALSPINATAPLLAVNAGGYAHFSGDVAEARIFTFDPGQFNTSLLLFPGSGPSDPYEVWANDYSLSNPVLSLDFDNGGLPSGIEWVTGGDPSVGSDDASVTPTFNNSAQNHFLFTFRRRDAAAADIGTTIVVEYGSDLAGWHNTAQHGVADGVSVDTATDLGGGFHQVTVTIPRSLALDGRFFARLKVSRR